jgi:hypothetical protein
MKLTWIHETGILIPVVENETIGKVYQNYRYE